MQDAPFDQSFMFQYFLFPLFLVFISLTSAHMCKCQFIDQENSLSVLQNISFFHYFCCLTFLFFPIHLKNIGICRQTVHNNKCSYVQVSVYRPGEFVVGASKHLFLSLFLLPNLPLFSYSSEKHWYMQANSSQLTKIVDFNT
jgi:hypothetical protein